MKRILLPIAIAAVLVAGACSSGSSKTSSGASTQASAANTDPVSIFVFGQYAAPSFAYPEVEPVLRAQIATVNAAGGVKGHQINLDFCNDQGTQPGATDCARTGTSGKYVAALSTYTRYGDAVLPLFQQAGIAMIGNTASGVQDFTNPASFPGQAPQGYVGGLVKAALAKPGCKVFTFIHWDTPTSTTAKPLIQKIVEAAGAKFLDENEGTGAADYGPVAATISGAGSTCAFSFLPGTDAVKWTIAQKQRDPNFIITAPVGVYGATVLKQLGSAGNGLILGNSLPSVSDTANPDVATFLAETTKAGLPAADITDNALLASSSLKLLLGAIASISGKVDQASTTKAMNNITKPATTIFGPYDTTKPNTQKDFARLFCTEAYLYGTNNGTITSLGAPTNVKDLFN